MRGVTNRLVIVPIVELTNNLSLVLIDVQKPPFNDFPDHFDHIFGRYGGVIAVHFDPDLLGVDYQAALVIGLCHQPRHPHPVSVV